MKLYHYPKCSTCRKAIKFLHNNNVQYELIDISQSPPSSAELEQMLDNYDGQVRKLFNTSGMQYRELGLKDKLPTMSRTEVIELLGSNGMLVKRPFLLNSTGPGLVGFKEPEWQALLAEIK